MMKRPYLLVLALVAAICGSSAYAASGRITKFTCEMTKLRGEYFEFSIRNLGLPNMEMIIDENNEMEPGVSTKSKNKFLKDVIVSTFNGQGEPSLSKGSSGIGLFGDSAGCDLVRMALYKNSGYRAGYLQLERHCSGNDRGMYSTVRCNVR